MRPMISRKHSTLRPPHGATWPTSTTCAGGPRSSGWLIDEIRRACLSSIFVSTVIQDAIQCLRNGASKSGSLQGRVVHCLLRLRRGAPWGHRTQRDDENESRASMIISELMLCEECRMQASALSGNGLRTDGGGIVLCMPLLKGKLLTCKLLPCLVGRGARDRTPVRRVMDRFHEENSGRQSPVGAIAATRPRQCRRRWPMRGVQSSGQAYPQAGR